MAMTDGKVALHVNTAPLHAINDVLEGLREGTVEGRMVLDMRLPIETGRRAESAATVR